MLRKNSHMEVLAVVDDNIHNQPECLVTQTGNKTNIVPPGTEFTIR